MIMGLTRWWSILYFSLRINALLAWFNEQDPLRQFNLVMFVVLIVTILVKTIIVILRAV
jgi:hypothetical protein